MSDRRFASGCVLLAALCLPLSANAQSASEPLTLPQAVAMALARAPEVAVAQAESDLAGASARLARTQYGPEAFVGTTPGYSSGLPVMVAGQVPSIVHVAVRQPIYDTSLRANILTARAAAVESETALERTRAETVRAVVLAYGRVAADGSLLSGARRALEAQEAISRRVSSLAAEGRVTAVDVDAAGLEVARAKQRVLDRTFAQEIDGLELKKLVGWPAGANLTLAGRPLSDLPAPPPSGNLETARAGDLETRSLEREVEALRAAAATHVLLLQPTVVAEAQYLRLAKYNHFDDYFQRFRENDFSVGIAISVPVWSGGRTSERAAAAKSRVERAEAALRGRAGDLELAVRRSEADLGRAAAQQAVARSSEALARERSRIASALAAEGRGEPDGADLADVALIRAQEETLEAEQAVLAARVSLLALRGDLLASLGTPTVSPR